MSEFHVVPGAIVSDILGSSRDQVMELIRESYLTHHIGDDVNPDSYFLRFEDKPRSRVIALPAYHGGSVDRIGIKWISSFPTNVSRGLPRASAILVLNDYETGYPIACLEAAGISAARTAASGTLAVRTLVQASEPLSVSFVGAGVIARTLCDHLAAAGITFTDVAVHDLDPTRADNLVRHSEQVLGAPARRAQELDAVLSRDLVVFATTAATPYVPPRTELRGGQILLNISLRDLAPELLLSANNVLDDVEHCLKADTSPHLAEQLTGSRDFVTGTLAGVLNGEVTLDPDLPTVFSPFGLGVLDIAVGNYVLEEAIKQEKALPIPGFFGETTSW